MLTWTDLKTKAVRLSRDTTPGTLTQLEQDMNTGYHMFNAMFSRYYSRKQQFTDIIAGQSIYQTPIDCVRVIGMTAAVGNGSNPYKVPVKEVRSEFEWRQITAYRYSSNWEAYYYPLGNDEFEIWPIPSQNVTNGIRFYYQAQDHDLSVDDIISSSLSPAQTCTVTNGSVVVTSTGATFTTQMVGLNFQVTGVTDTSWYEIVAVPNSSTLTLRSAYVGNSGSGYSSRIGQLSILPSEYQDVPVHYGLGLFFSGKGNVARSQFHLGTEDKPGMFYSMVNSAVQNYSSSTEGNVIFNDGDQMNAWFLTPVPSTS